MDWDKEIEKQIAKLNSFGSLLETKHSKEYVSLEFARDVFITGATGLNLFFFFSFSLYFFFSLKTVWD
jgi:hypothetical protein